MHCLMITYVFVPRTYTGAVSVKERERAFGGPEDAAPRARAHSCQNDRPKVSNACNLRYAEEKSASTLPCLCFAKSQYPALKSRCVPIRPKRVLDVFLQEK